MTTPRPTPLAEMLTLYRAVHRQGMRELAKEIGVSAATVARIEAGKETDVATFLKLIAWLRRAP
jgi:transcriptional regulator with XRE-family HTH domain